MLFPEPDFDELFGFSHLHKAALGLIRKPLEEVIDIQGDIDVPDIDGRTPLSWAVQRDDIDLTNRLIVKGADCNRKDRRGVTPLLYAARTSERMIKALLDAGADVEVLSSVRQSVLHRAATSSAGSDPVLGRVQTLIKAGSRINVCDDYGNTPLHHAIEWRHVHIATYLIECGADITLCSKSGTNSLSFAVRLNVHPILELIFSKGEYDHTGRIDQHGTLMHLAAECADARSLQLLTKGRLSRRDINVKNKKGLSPCQLALQRQAVDAEWREAWSDFMRSIDKDFPFMEPSHLHSKGVSTFRQNLDAMTNDGNDTSDDEFEDAVETQEA